MKERMPDLALVLIVYWLKLILLDCRIDFELFHGEDGNNSKESSSIILFT